YSGPVCQASIDRAPREEYQQSMTSNTKSSITLPAEELRLVRSLKSQLKLKSNVEVVRRGLRLLKDTTDRASLRQLFQKASAATRVTLQEEIEELDHLAAEGLD